MFEVNVFGLLAVSRAFLPALRQGRGKILNISSIASKLVIPFHGTYSASKVAVNTLSQSLRVEVAPLGVQVSVIILGNFKTPIWEKGERLGHAVAKKLPPETWQLYGSRYRQAGAYLTQMGQNGASPDLAAHKIGQILQARRSKAIYWVGPGVWLFGLAEMAPAGVQDWLVYRLLGLKA